MQIPNFKFNIIDNADIIQIYGEVSGIATRSPENREETCNSYQYTFSFHRGSNFVTVKSNPKDHTTWNEKVLREKIIQVYNEY